MAMVICAWLLLDDLVWVASYTQAIAIAILHLEKV